MNLKEAFRYQNFLDSTMSSLMTMLRSPSNTIHVEQNHLRSKANPDAEDEMIDATAERPFDVSVDKLIGVCSLLVTEKANVSLAIDDAKRAHRDATGFCLDAEMATNKCRQSLASVLRTLGNSSVVKRQTTGTAFKFNAEGNQTPYVYTVEEIRKPDYDVDAAKSLSRNLSNNSDMMSSRADSCLITTEVDFTPIFNVNDSIGDVIATGVTELQGIETMAP